MNSVGADNRKLDNKNKVSDIESLDGFWKPRIIRGISRF